MTQPSSARTIRTSLTLPNALMARVKVIRDRRGLVTTADALRWLLTEAVERIEAKFEDRP